MELTGGRFCGSVTGHPKLIIEDGSDRKIDLKDTDWVLPSLCDVHVHFREPGQSYKETIRQGSLAAAHGGYTAVCTMPNLDPPPHDLASLEQQLVIIRRDAVIPVYPYGAITREQSGRGELADLEAMAEHVIAFSDDGKGVQDAGLMREAMQRAKALGRLITAHCEDESLLAEGKVRESEWRQIERDLKLADETGCGYHVCHISCKESVRLIREAKQSGVDVTCETAPHYLLLDTGDVRQGVAADPAGGGRFQMNPPIKDHADRLALLEGIADGTIDMIATDHAPHSAEEKSRGFGHSLNGITGLECAFPVLYTGLVRKGLMTMEQLADRMAIAPRRRFGIREENSYVVIDTQEPYTIDPEAFFSKGKSTPFMGWNVYGRVVLTVCSGRIVYDGLK